MARRLNTSPDGCQGPNPEPERVARSFGRVIGGSPIWGGFYARFNEQSNAFVASQAPRTMDGWRIKVLWLIAPDVSTPVSLSGHNVETGAPLRFAIGGAAPATDTPVLDPAHPAIPVQDERWKEFPSYLYFASAGCYVLTASWSGGSWELGFGLGQ